MKIIRSLPYPKIILVLIGLALAVALRASLIDFKSSDYFGYTKQWYYALKTGGFAAFGQDFSNYNLPYLYLLYVVIRFFPDLPAQIAVKIPSLLADFVSAYLVYRLVRIKYSDLSLPLLAGLAALFAPTVVLNSAFWGQADALYTSALLATILFLIQRQSAWALLSFGLALSFKAQAVFLAPLLLVMFLRREIPWRTLLLAPLVMAVSLLPALIAGRPLVDLLLIYPSQAGQYEMLSMHAPSAYALLPDNSQTYQYFYPAGLILAAAVVSYFVILVQQSRAKLTPGLLVQVSLASILLLPFLLPKMHERYFYPADVISIVFAAFYPAYYYVAIAMSVISFLAYQPYLFGVELVPMPFLALAVLFVVSIVTWHTLRDLYGSRHLPAEPIPGPPPG